jgi:hypothetical protein
MTDKKSWGSTVLGWFVVKEGEAQPDLPPSGEAEAPSEASPEAAPAPAAPPVFEGGAPPSPGGNVDFPAVFEAAGIAAEERELFAKAAGLLSTLPQGTDPATRKAIVEASLKAFGIPIDQIIETGAHSIQTLEGYIEAQAAKTRVVAEESQQLIADYEAKIRDVRALLERRIAEQAAVQASCNGKKLEVQQVLEFFGQEAVAKVVRESPKLVEPAAPPEGKD